MNFYCQSKDKFSNLLKKYSKGYKIIEKIKANITRDIIRISTYYIRKQKNKKYQNHEYYGNNYYLNLKKWVINLKTLDILYNLDKLEKVKRLALPRWLYITTYSLYDMEQWFSMGNDCPEILKLCNKIEKLPPRLKKLTSGNGTELSRLIFPKTIKCISIRLASNRNLEFYSQLEFLPKLKILKIGGYYFHNGLLKINFPPSLKVLYLDCLRSFSDELPDNPIHEPQDEIKFPEKLKILKLGGGPYAAYIRKFPKTLKKLILIEYQRSFFHDLIKNHSRKLKIIVIPKKT